MQDWSSQQGCSLLSNWQLGGLQLPCNWQGYPGYHMHEHPAQPCRLVALLQAYASTGSLAREFTACLRAAHDYIEKSQVRAELPNSAPHEVPAGRLARPPPRAARGWGVSAARAAPHGEATVLRSCCAGS